MQTFWLQAGSFKHTARLRTRHSHACGPAAMAAFPPIWDFTTQLLPNEHLLRGGFLKKAVIINDAEVKDNRKYIKLCMDNTTLRMFFPPKLPSAVPSSGAYLLCWQNFVTGRKTSGATMRLRRWHKRTRSWMHSGMRCMMI